MSYSTLQTISTIVIFAGAVMAGLGGLGQYYFGRQIDKEKDEIRIANENRLNTKVDILLKGNDELKETIKPFEELARQRFPGEDVNTALDNLTKDIARLEKEHQKTYFTVKVLIDEPQSDGSRKYKFKLTPVGHNIIPIFAIQCDTQNKTKITKFEVASRTLPAMSYDRTAKDKSAFRKEYREMYPSEVIVEITTEKDPGKLNINIDPFKATQ